MRFIRDALINAAETEKICERMTNRAKLSFGWLLAFFLMTSVADCTSPL